MGQGRFSSTRGVPVSPTVLGGTLGLAQGQNPQPHGNDKLGMSPELSPQHPASGCPLAPPFPETPRDRSRWDKAHGTQRLRPEGVCTDTRGGVWDKEHPHTARDPSWDPAGDPGPAPRAQPSD